MIIRMTVNDKNCNWIVYRFAAMHLRDIFPSYFNFSENDIQEYEENIYKEWCRFVDNNKLSNSLKDDLYVSFHDEVKEKDEGREVVYYFPKSFSAIIQ